MSAPELLILDTLVQQVIQERINSGDVRKQIEKAATKAIDDAIDSAFGYSSPFRKSMEASIKEVLPVTNPTDLSAFAHAVREVITAKLGSVADETAAKHVGELIESLLPDDPIITLGELHDAFKEKILKGSGCHCDDDGDNLPHTFEIEESTSEITGTKFFHLWCSEEEGASQYGSKVMNFAFHVLESGLAECYSVNVGGKKQEYGMFIGPMYGFDAMVFRLATKTAKLDRYNTRR